MKYSRPLLSLLVLWLCSSAHAADQSALVIESVVLAPLHAAEVPAQQVGVLREIVTEDGATVAKGEVLARLDSRQAELDVAKAKLEAAQAAAKANNRVKVDYADKSLAVAQAELKRSEESIEQFAKSISQSQLDVERLTVEKLTLERQQAEHELELDRLALKLKEQELAAAQLKSDLHAVTAPFAGTVVLVRGRIGEWVEVGAPVLRLVAVDKLRAEGFLSVENAGIDLIGREVLFRRESGSTARGRLRFVSPEMDAVSRQVRVWAELDNSAGELRSGEQGSLEIVR
jgi:multidrug efflux pump subunit AcrA (membrane-fusion protein)